MSSFLRLAQHQSPPESHGFARKLRKDPPSGEQILWAELRMATRGRKFRFRRQHPIHPYIVDFVCLKLRLVVEIDGVSHDMRRDNDNARDQWLLGLGYETMRFTNDEVVTNRDGVVVSILNRAERLIEGFDIPHP